MSQFARNHRPAPARAWIAVIAAVAFVFAPFSALAQQQGGAEQPASAGEESAEADPDAAEGEEASAQEDPAQAEGEQQEAKPKGPTPKVFLLPAVGVRDEISSIIPERIGEMSRKQLQGQAGVDLLPTYEKLQEQFSAGGGRANAAVAEAKRLYTSGIGLLTAGEDKKAADSFQKAVDIMEQNIADLDNFDVLADAYKNMALAYFNAGFDLDGRKKMKVYGHLRPNDELDAEKFPKELIEVYEDEATKVEKGGPGKLTIKSTGQGSGLVYIDGTSKGKLPATVDDVGYGYHYLVVRGSSGGVWAEQIRVRGRGKEQTFEVELGQGQAKKEEEDAQESKESDEPAFYTGLVDAIKTGSFGTDLQPYLAELTTRTGAQFVAWVVMVRDDSGYSAVPFVYRADDGMMVRADKVHFAIDLSNLRAGVSEVGANIAAAVKTMPEDKAFASVELVKPPEPEPEPTTAQKTDQTGEEGEGTSQPADEETVVAQKEDESKKDEAVKPPPTVPPSESEEADDTWMWIGIGGGAATAVALVVGGVVLATSSGGSGGASSFDAKLTW